MIGANMIPGALRDDNKLMLQVREYMESIGVIDPDWGTDWANNTLPYVQAGNKSKRAPKEDISASGWRPAHHVMLLPAHWAPYLFKYKSTVPGTDIRMSEREVRACEDLLDTFHSIRFVTVRAGVVETSWHAARRWYPVFHQCLEFVYTSLPPSLGANGNYIRAAGEDTAKSVPRKYRKD